MKLLPLICLMAFGANSYAQQHPQASPPRKDIPAIAKAANGAVVSIVMSDRDGKPISQGSGFLVDKDGFVVTNYHLIAEGTSAVVKFPDGAEFPVDGVLASDKYRDVAIIKIHGRIFKTLPLGDSDRLQVGEEVVAIGNPLSLESTVSNGIVSGIRTAEKLGGKFLQITTPISPGSSGGPLFNMRGEVVGITTMYLEGGENLNFAIPIPNDTVDWWVLNAPNDKLESLPNEHESSKAQDTSTPDLEETVEFMGRMVDAEHRQILQGVMKGAELHSTNGPAITIVSYQFVMMALVTGKTTKSGYLEPTYTILTDGGNKAEDFPRYASFALGDIDPSSIISEEGGLDASAVAEFDKGHPRNCWEILECINEVKSFMDSPSHKLTVVKFHTTDLKPLIEYGNCSGTSGCRRGETSAGGLMFFKGKDRAERFVTALIHAVSLGGGKPDAFPPTR